MDEHLEQNDSLPPASEGQEVVALIKRMQQQLLFLEKKIDILISQTESRPAGDRHFSKSQRSFGRPHRPYDRERRDASEEKRFDRRRRFEKPHGSDENRDFGHKKKSYSYSSKSSFSKERHFEKRHDGEKAGFVRKKKPFSFRRKKV
ncbi:MAG: hypothetical protein ABIC68_03815 [Candidatus Omnitrophota bacterium]